MFSKLIATKPGLQFESGKIGKLPVLMKERKTKQRQIAFFIIMIHIMSAN